MTTYDITVGSIGQPSAHAMPGLARLVRVVDFKITPYLSADVLHVFNVAAGVSILTAGYRLLRKEGATSASHTMGDTGSASQWIASADANATVGATQMAASGWEHYTSDNFVNFVLGANISNAKIAFFAVALNVGLDFATET